MKILLLNDNPVVNKLVTLSAQKTSDELDVVDSIDSIQSGEYDLLVVDDTMYNEDMFSEIKSKIMFSHSLYICSRDSATVDAFSSTLKKPFLPTDLVELFLMFSKKEATPVVSKEEKVEEVDTGLDELEEFSSEELKLDEETNELDELDLSLDDELDLSLEDDLDLDDELLLEDDELEDLDEELLLGDEDLEDGESVLDDEEAQKVKDLLDETSEESQEITQFDPQVAADELGLPLEEIEEFIQDFINQADEFKDDLYSSLAANDLDSIQITSHKLKGVAANLRIEEALSAISIVNESSDTTEIEAALDDFYKIIARLSEVNTIDEDDVDTDLDSLEEFSSEDEEVTEPEEELVLEEELELDDNFEEELSLEEDDLELDEELPLDEEVSTETSSEEEEVADLDDLEEELSLDDDEDDLNLEEELELNDDLEEELSLEEDEELDEEVTEPEEELVLEEELELDDNLEEELSLDDDEELLLEEEELDIETQIENAVEELSDEDLESELDEETLLEIATNEIDDFASLNSNDLKLAFGEEVDEEVNTETLEISSDDTDLDSFEETHEEEAVSEEVQANSIEALENLLVALKDKNVVASMKGTKININITIGDE